MGYPDLPDVPIVRVAQDDLTNRMSEYVVMHCLMHLRDQRRYDADQHARRWQPDREPPIAGEVRVGIMGFGVLGQDAARKLKVMGFDVAGWSRTPKSVKDFRVYSGAGELDAFLARTDILVSLIPLTPDTCGILNRSLFGKLAHDGKLGGPVLINAGRGKLQVEADILASLDDGALRAATLDVFEVEPLPEDSPLWMHPRITISPHNAAVSEPEATARYIAGQIRRHEAGEPFQNVVDQARGY
jgi:glyoxylate/hydroxypyruvate reductase A